MRLTHLLKRCVFCRPEDVERLKEQHFSKLVQVQPEEILGLRVLHVGRLLLADLPAVELRTAHVAKLAPELVERARFANATIREMERLRDEFGADEVPDRILDKLVRVYEEKDPTRLQDVATRIYKSMEIHVLALWASKKIPGPHPLNARNPLPTHFSPERLSS